MMLKWMNKNTLNLLLKLSIELLNTLYDFKKIGKTKISDFSINS